MENISLRNYLIAHAPAEPQPWFEPSMSPKPVLPSTYELTDEQRQQLNSELADHEPDRCDPAVLDFIARRDSVQKSLNAWREEQKKQRYIQWPSAWADHQLMLIGMGETLPKKIREALLAADKVINCPELADTAAIESAGKQLHEALSMWDLPNELDKKEALNLQPSE